MSSFKSIEIFTITYFFGAGFMLFIVLIGLLIVIGPINMPTDNDSIQTNTYEIDGEAFDVEIRLGDVEGYPDVIRSSSFMLFSRSYVTPNDPTVEKVYERLEAGMSGMGKLDKANYILGFIQDNIEYVSDSESHYSNDYVQYPAETLLLKMGDCEDMAILLHTLYSKAGLDSVILYCEDHFTVGVNVPLDEGYYVTLPFYGIRYYIAEATGTIEVGGSYADDVKFVFKPEISYFGLFCMIVGFSGLAFVVRINRVDDEEYHFFTVSKAVVQ